MTQLSNLYWMPEHLNIRTFSNAKLNLVMQLTLKNATFRDVTELCIFNQLLIRDEGSNNTMVLKELEQRMLGLFNNGYQATFITIDDVNIGYVLFVERKNDRAEPYVFLRHFFIQESYRRQGIGKDVISNLKAEQFKDKKVLLEVLVSNERGRNFWESCGFEYRSMTMELPI